MHKFYGVFIHLQRLGNVWQLFSQISWVYHPSYCTYCCQKHDTERGAILWLKDNIDIKVFDYFAQLAKCDQLKKESKRLVLTIIWVYIWTGRQLDKIVHLRLQGWEAEQAEWRKIKNIIGVTESLRKVSRAKW